jgi:outer membrane protein assembly factor BamB
MFKALLPLLLLCSVQSLFAQSKITISTREAGVDLRTNTPISAQEYRFDLPVFRFYAVPEQDLLTVLLRKKNPTTQVWKPSGRLAVFNVESGQAKWQRKQKYGANNIQQVDNVIFEQTAAKLSRLDLETGKPIWKRQSTAYWVYPELNMALCYDYGTTGPNTLHGINIKTGQSQWRREVPGEFGWQKAEMLGDSTLMVVSEGLHTVGLTDGKGWAINRVAHAKKTDMAKVGLTVLGGVAAASAGYMLMPTGSFSDYLLNISSNVLYADNGFYFAAKEKISAHSLNGEKIWETTLDRKKTSKSHLFQEGNTLYMINMGYASKYGRPAALGNPYVAAFDAGSGEQLFSKEWEERKNFVSDYMIQGNELYLLYRDKVDIQRYSPEGLTQKYIVRIDEKSNMHSFVSDQVFILEDSTFKQASLDQEHFHLISEKGELFRFDNGFENPEKVDPKQVYQNYLNTEGYLFVGNDKESFILEGTTLRKVARCEAPTNSLRYGSKLYYTKDNSIFVLDISQFAGTKVTGGY